MLSRWQSWKKVLIVCRSYTKAPLFNKLSEEQLWQTLQTADLHPNDLALGLLNLTSTETPDSIKRDERLEPVLQRIRANISSTNAKGVSNLLIACRRLDAGDAEFWGSIFTQMEPLVTKFTSSQIVSLFIHLSGHQFYKQKLLVALVNEAIFKAQEFTSKQVCLLLVAFTKFRPDPIRPLVNRLCEHTIRISKSLRPGDISIILNSLRNLEIFQPQLLNRLCVVALDQVADFKPQETVNTISALAHFGVFQPVLLTRLLGAALNSAASFSSLGMALCLEALVKFEVFDGDLTARFCKYALQKAPEFSCSSIANVLYALAKFDFFHQELVGRFVKLTRGKIGLLNAKSISKLMFALNKFNVYDDSIMRMVCGEIKRHSAAYDSPVLLRPVMAALAKFCMMDQDVLKSLSFNARKYADKFTPRDALCVLHSSFTLGWYDPVLYKIFYPKLQNIKNLNPAELEQLYLCNKCVSIERPGWELLPSDVRQTTPPVPSAAMTQTAFSLRFMRHEFQQYVMVRGMIVDFSLPVLRVVVLVEGPKKFCHNSKRPLGRTLLKRRLLMQCRWSVAAIPYHAWNGTLTHQRTLLKDLIEQASRQALTPPTHPFAAASNIPS